MVSPQDVLHGFSFIPYTLAIISLLLLTLRALLPCNSLRTKQEPSVNGTDDQPSWYALRGGRFGVALKVVRLLGSISLLALAGVHLAHAYVQTRVLIINIVFYVSLYIDIRSATSRRRVIPGIYVVTCCILTVRTEDLAQSSGRSPRMAILRVVRRLRV